MKALAAGACLLLAMPAAAQHAGHDMAAMPGMSAPPAEPPAATPDHAGHSMGAMPGMSAKPSAAAPQNAAAGTNQPPGKAAAPPPPADHAADAVYDPVAMADARARLGHEHGGMHFSRIFFNLAEWQVRAGHDGYRWDGEGWYGGDLDRLVVNTEGEGLRGNRLERAEVQALYSHAIGPYFDLQGGVRQDFGRNPHRTYATIGVEGLAPCWFEVEARLFLSQRGDLRARVEATYDQLLTQRLVLQPRAELNFAAQDSARDRIGSGLSDAELGLRLRYEITRRFAPYVGISWTRTTGHSARFARAAGEDAEATATVLGLRTWF